MQTRQRAAAAGVLFVAVSIGACGAVKDVGRDTIGLDTHQERLDKLAERAKEAADAFYSAFRAYRDQPEPQGAQSLEATRAMMAESSRLLDDLRSKFEAWSDVLDEAIEAGFTKEGGPPRAMVDRVRGAFDRWIGAEEEQQRLLDPCLNMDRENAKLCLFDVFLKNGDRWLAASKELEDALAELQKYR